MQNQHLLEIGHALLHNSVSIEEWWKQNAVFLSGIKNVSSPEEVAIWSSAYYRYGQFLLNKGYAKKAEPHVAKVLSIVEENKQLLGDQYENWSTTILETQSAVLFKMGKTWQAYNIMKQLSAKDPDKDDYRDALNTILPACMWIFVWPCYAIIACLWLVDIINKHTLGLNIFPSWFWDVTWVIWIALIVIQFAVPYMAKKLRK